jgi:uncharacterized protein (DUF433 family)
MTQLYGGIDPRDIPTYSIGDVARYLRIPSGTIRSWTIGRKYPVIGGFRFFEPLIRIPHNTPRLLSFTNLVEVHVLRAIRHNHKIQLDKVRIALDFLEDKLQVSNPLAREEFSTDKVDLFIERYGSLINASKKGELQLKNALNVHLERIEPDATGRAIKLFPFTRSQEEGSPRIVVIDPRIAFGRLVITGTGISTKVVTERYQAGDSIDDLANDYGCERLSIEEAIRCELPLAA